MTPSVRDSDCEVRGLTAPFTAAGTDWQPAAPPWSSSRPIFTLVAEVLPIVEDDLAAELIECLALALADRNDEVQAVRAVLSSVLALSHTQQVEDVRLRRRVAGLLDARRPERGPHE